MFSIHYTWFKKRESKYTYELCKELALKYNSRIETFNRFWNRNSANDNA